MSRFLSQKYDCLEPYTPGEQPKDTEYIKLNTNESPFPPSENACKMASAAAKRLNLYPDPNCRELSKKFAELVGVAPSMVLATNGSDEILNFAFMAFCDSKTPAVFADITYGFYQVFAELNGIPYEEIPLKEDFSVYTENYLNVNKTIFIANPNAPTGKVLPIHEIERILQSNPDNVVVIDEAYVDFGGQSCIPLTYKYNNLLVTQTFSKSRSMAGARLGFGIACPELINDLNMVKYSTNPYNINSMTMAAGLGVIDDNEYTVNNCREIIKNREYVQNELSELGFYLTDSSANFVFARHEKIGGEELYLKLKQRGILVRHFSKVRISEFNRITIGTYEQMKKLICAVKEILEEKNENF